MGLLESLCHHRHVSLPSPRENGRQIFVILITYHVTNFVQINIWTMGFMCSPFLSPFAFGFLASRAKSGSPFPGCVLLTTVFISVGDGHTESVPCTAYSLSSLSSSLDARRKFIPAQFGKLTASSRMYDRGVKNLPSRQTSGLRYRIETLVGITGAKMAKYRVTWYEAVSAPFKVVWRPHLLIILVFVVLILHDTETALGVN